MPKSKTFFVETGEAWSESEVQQALATAGVKAHNVRETTELRDGYVFTNTLIAGIWNYETG